MRVPAVDKWPLARRLMVIGAEINTGTALAMFVIVLLVQVALPNS